MERMMTYKELRVSISVLKCLFAYYEKAEGEDKNNIANAVMHITRDVEQSFRDNTGLFRDWLTENHICVSVKKTEEREYPYREIYDSLCNQRYGGEEPCQTI